MSHGAISVFLALAVVLLGAALVGTVVAALVWLDGSTPTTALLRGGATFGATTLLALSVLTFVVLVLQK